MALHPLPGYGLVTLGKKYEHVSAATKVYDGATSGILETINPSIEQEGEYDGAKGNLVFWEELVTGSTLKRNGIEYSLVHLASLRGYEDLG
jgi:hypothetical protein